MDGGQRQKPDPKEGPSVTRSVLLKIRCGELPSLTAGLLTLNQEAPNEV